MFSDAFLYSESLLTSRSTWTQELHQNSRHNTPSSHIDKVNLGPGGGDINLLRKLSGFTTIFVFLRLTKHLICCLNVLFYVFPSLHCSAIYHYPFILYNLVWISFEWEDRSFSISTSVSHSFFLPSPLPYFFFPSLFLSPSFPLSSLHLPASSPLLSTASCILCISFLPSSLLSSPVSVLQAPRPFCGRRTHLILFNSSGAAWKRWLAIKPPSPSN